MFHLLLTFAVIAPPAAPGRTPVADDAARYIKWASLAPLSDGKLARPRLNPLTLAKGRIGYFRCDFKAVQVLDGKRMLARPVRVKDAPLLLVYWPTDRYRDGELFSLPKEQLFEVTGTTTYQLSLGGTNTVSVIKPFDYERIRKHVEDWEAKQRRRMWVDRSGKHRIEAEYIDLVSDKRGRLSVLLEKANGERIRVAMSLLSKPDQKWVRTRKRAEKRKK